VWYSRGTLFEDNVVRRSRYGLHYMYSDDNRFRRNRFEDNQVGAAVMYSRGVELTENAFSFSNGIAAYGLLVKDADDVYVERNRFVGNATALFPRRSEDKTGALGSVAHFVAQAAQKRVQRSDMLADKRRQLGSRVA